MPLNMEELYDTPMPIQCKFEIQGYRQLPYCFLMFVILNRNIIKVSSYNDSSGKVMYGGLLDRCQMRADQDYDTWPVLSPKILFNSFQIEKHNSAHPVTSQPYQLCFCERRLNCSGVKRIQIHRGQRFSLSLLAKDQLENSTSTLVANCQNTWNSKAETKPKLSNSSTKLL